MWSLIIITNIALVALLSQMYLPANQFLCIPVLLHSCMCAYSDIQKAGFDPDMFPIWWYVYVQKLGEIQWRGSKEMLSFEQNLIRIFM